MQTDPDDAIRLIQSGLDKFCHRPGMIDGRWGVRTARALRQLIAANGRPASLAPQGPLPWITEAKTALGRHEARDRSWLVDWLNATADRWAIHRKTLGAGISSKPAFA